MHAARTISRAALAIVFLIFCSVLYVRFLDPSAQADVLVIDDSVAFYIDTLATVEKGSVRIPNAGGMIRSVKISFEEKGKAPNYKIKDEGWHVIVSWDSGKRKLESAARINTYVPGGDFSVSLYNPDNICIIKRADSEYAEVSGC
jgi:hypothetical protein